MTHRLLRLYAIICLFVLLLPVPQPGVTPPVDAPQVMPPHPSLRKRITCYFAKSKWTKSSEEMAQFLEACVRSRVNTVVSGGAGSGRTTLLNNEKGMQDGR